MSAQPRRPIDPAVVDALAERVSKAAVGPMADRIVEMLVPELAEALADVVATPKLLTVKELAAALGVSTWYVYENSEALGAIRLPDSESAKRKRSVDSPCGRLRFDLARTRALLANRPEAQGDVPPAAPPPSSSRRRSRRPREPGSVLTPRRSPTPEPTRRTP
jgi:hypothetical protein